MPIPLQLVSWKAMVLSESAAWVSPWSPPGASLVNTDRIRFFVDRGVATVVRAEPADPSRIEDLVDELVTSDRGQSVARLFGAGVIPEFRGRGAYRGLLAARLDDARDRGATLALVHARSGTSGPILCRVGFVQVGQQTVIEVPVMTTHEQES